MGLLNALAPLVRNVSTGVAANLEGQEIGRQRQRKTLLEDLALQRQAEEAKAESERRTLLNELTKAQTQKLSEPDKPKYQLTDGMRVDVDNAIATPIQGLPKSTTAEPPRGSPEALRILRAEAEARNISGGGSAPRAPRTPTGEQEKSYNWHRMMTEAAPILDEMESKIRPDAIWAAINAPELTRPLLNRLLTPEEQQYYNALRKFGAGQLRKETGAAFGAGELADIFSRYGPTGGNSPEVLAQIRAGRKNALETMGLMAIPARQYYEALQRGGVPMDTPEDAAAEATGFPSAGVQPGSPARPAAPVTPPASFEAWKRSRGGRP